MEVTLYIDKITKHTSSFDFDESYGLEPPCDKNSNPCDYCVNNPKKIGNCGICHCILGSPKITC